MGIWAVTLPGVRAVALRCQAPGPAAGSTLRGRPCLALAWPCRACSLADRLSLVCAAARAVKAAACAAGKLLLA
jgi:hypothetical protein